MAESRGGRPMSASQRPTGGDKAMATKKQYFLRRKYCFAAPHRRRQGDGYQEAILPAQEGVPFLRREDRRYQLQRREDAHVVYLRARQNCSAPHLRRLHSSPAPLSRGDQAGAQYRTDSVRRADLVTRVKRQCGAKLRLSLVERAAHFALFKEGSSWKSFSEKTRNKRG